jgi:acetyl-CoA acetyltransferase
VTDAYIGAALRTPVGKHGGALASVRADDLAAIPIRAVVERSGIDPMSIDDVILGCTNQAGEDNRNVARMASLVAGLPVEVPAQRVNRLCGSGLQAAASAAQAIKAGEGAVFVAGGVENMTRAPYVMLKSGDAWSRKAPEVADTTVGWRFPNPRLKKEWTIALGETAELVADRYKIGRAEQDAFAVRASGAPSARSRSACSPTNWCPLPFPTARRSPRTSIPAPARRSSASRSSSRRFARTARSRRRARAA